ncbi:uncharacterized protein LOC141623615 [Silene latifolia]|uniref:uncharacterized protein LOC141623615 n=1 Tax=Silene latifolia TaxID=37657 RepID=UPI003D76E254
MNGKQGTGVLPGRALAKPVKRNIAPKSVRPAGQQTQAATLPTIATSTAATDFSAANGNNGNASGNGHASSNGHVAGKGYSIYIGHLPYDATPKLVEQEFKKFGCIKKNGIQVRSNKGYVFGFVEYEDASAQENALKMGTIQIGDREVQIEEKKTDARVDNYTARRGGYRNNGYRRGNYSNGRGYARNDYGKGSIEGPPHGRGNGNRYVHQNGGGRGACQGGGPK